MAILYLPLLSRENNSGIAVLRFLFNISTAKIISYKRGVCKIAYGR